MVLCQTCKTRTVKGAFVDKAEHDRHAGGPWNGHTIEEINQATLPKARWMLFCPLCMDSAASGTPETGFTTKHPTLAMSAGGDEIVECSNCHTRYFFNLTWTFETKAPKPGQLSLPMGDKKAYIVRPYGEDGEIEVYLSEEAADARIQELKDEALQDAGFLKVDEDVYETPTGARVRLDEALYQAEANCYFAMPPEQAEEVDLLG